MKERIEAFRGIYRFLSNFYPCQVKYEGIVYPSSEHAYQAAKTSSQAKKLGISEYKTAFKAKCVGHKLQLRKNWESAKESIMFEILCCKFEQNSNLRKRLLDTNNAFLVEGNSWGDTYWGVCNGVGKNRLGKLLMRVRRRLR